LKQIFIVDDEESVRYTIKTGIEQMDENFEVIEIENGQKCLDLLHQDRIPDLILLDIMMPEMSGWELFNQIKDNVPWRNIPIIFLSARTDRIAKEAGGFYGDDFIEKPFTIPELKKRIDRVFFQ